MVRRKSIFSRFGLERKDVQKEKKVLDKAAAGSDWLSAKDRRALQKRRDEVNKMLTD